MPSSWDRQTLLQVVIAYADRYDADVSDQLSYMLGLAEDRMSRIMRNREMSAQTMIPIDGSPYYELPSDFAGLRDVHIDGPTTLQYVNPEQANNIVLDNIANTYYTIIANQIHLYPTLTVPEGKSNNIHITYYQRVTPLLGNSDTNWVLTNHSDIYKTAMSAEVEAFVKNDQRAIMFWQQLDSMFAEIESRDWKDRWSGTSLSTRLEHQR